MRIHRLFQREQHEKEPTNMEEHGTVQCGLNINVFLKKDLEGVKRGQFDVILPVQKELRENGICRFNCHEIAKGRTINIYSNLHTFHYGLKQK